MRVSLLAVGRLKAGPERELGERYLTRARAAGRSVGLSGFETTEITESRNRDAGGRSDEEAAALLAKLPQDGRAIVLDERGRALPTAEFTELLARWRDEGVAEATVFIGGPDGHGAAVLERANVMLSLGPMTWPHQLVRILIAEQLYRAVTIMTGHPYHRA